MVKTFKERLFTEIFPGPKLVPKTLVFAKDDAHAERIVETFREEFGQEDVRTAMRGASLEGEPTIGAPKTVDI